MRGTLARLGTAVFARKRLLVFALLGLLVVSAIAFPIGASARTVSANPAATAHLAAPVHPLLSTSLPLGPHSLVGSPWSHPIPFRAQSRFPVSPGTLGAIGIPSSMRSPSPLAHPSSGPSTATNYFLNNSNCSNTPAIVNPSSNPQVLTAASFTLQPLWNGTGGTPCNGPLTPSAFFYSNGLVETYHSTNGGLSWSSGGPRANVTHWGTKTDPTNGSLPVLGDVSVPEAPNILAGGNDGSTFLATTYEEVCDTLGGPCSQPSGVNGTWGIAVAHSSDSGATWKPWVQVSAVKNSYLSYFVPAGSCGGPGYTNPLPANVTENPWIAYSAGSHDAIVTWDVAHLIVNLTLCQLFITNFTDQYSISTDGGLTWSAPGTLKSDLGTEQIVPVIGPAPSYTIHIIGADYGVQNATVTSAGNLLFTYTYWNSTNTGATWTGPNTVGTLVATEANGAATPDSFSTFTSPMFTADNWSASPYKGNLYVVWQDNQSGSNLGFPAIDFIKRTPGGLSWGAPEVITPPSHALTYYLPSVSVAPSGAIWVTYLGVNQSSVSGGGNVYTFGEFSTNGGTSWSPQFLVSDALSLPDSILRTMGMLGGVAATANGTFPVWTDCRSGGCYGAPFAEQIFTASVHALNISSTVAGVKAKVSVFGITSSVTLPANTGVDQGTSITVSVPQWLPDPSNSSAVASFQGFSGLSSSTNTITTFTYPGYGSLVAHYVDIPASWIAGTFYPYYPSLQPKLWLNSQPVTLTPSSSPLNATYNVTVASGAGYIVNASQLRYNPINNHAVGVSPRATTTYNVDLTRLNGTVSGRVVTPNLPTTVTVTLNGSALPVSGGLFTKNVPWGVYSLLATAPGLTAYGPVPVIVNPNLVTGVTATLNGAFLTGNVFPAKSNVRISIDGTSATANYSTSSTPNFNVTVLGGWHNVSASAPGYNLVTKAVNVAAGASALVDLNITNLGWIPGSVGPVGVLNTVTLRITNASAPTGSGFQPVDKSTGAFNATLPGGYTWHLNFSAPGYISQVVNVTVSPGNSSTRQDITLVKSSGGTTGCQATNTCPQPQQNNTAAPFPYWIIAVIVVVVVVAAVVAIVLMRRRGGGMSPQSMDEQPPQESPDDQLYGGSNPSELPRLQSDGSMGPPGGGQSP